MTALFLSRLTLARDPSVEALSALLNPPAEGARRDAHHRLLWSAFAGNPDATRDFLWREMGRGQFMVLSPRPPGQGALFEPPEVKEFDPALAAGDRLTFVLRANATRTVKVDELAPNGNRKRKHIDLVMDRLRGMEGARASQRMAAAQEAAESWMAGQGARHGFALRAVNVSGYSVSVVPGLSGRKGRRPQFGVLDMEGQLEVTDPSAFLSRLAAGFGRAKSFGCGLMLIRRG